MIKQYRRGRQRSSLSSSHLIIALAVWALFFHTGLARADFYSKTLPEMQARFDSIRDYRCLYRAYSAKNGKTADVSFRYFFLKPKQIRMETINGKYPGTVLIYNPQKRPDKVKVRVGNPVIAVMQKAIYGDYFHHRDKKVTDLGGFGIMESDWGWFIEIHREMARFGRTEAKKDVMFEGQPALYYLLVSANPEKTLQVAREELWIDKATYAPLKFTEYDRHGTVIREVEYKNMAVDVGLEESLFSAIKTNNHP